MLTIVAVLFFVFLFINVPVAFALALATIPTFLFTDYMPMTVAVQRMYGATLSFPLLAVPFFILAGNLMNTSGITERLLQYPRFRQRVEHDAAGASWVEDAGFAIDHHVVTETLARKPRGREQEALQDRLHE